MARYDAPLPEIHEDVLEELERHALGRGHALGLHRRVVGRRELERGAHRVVGLRGDAHVGILAPTLPPATAMVPGAQMKPDSPTYRGGSREPLVLLHGGGGTRRLWRTTIPLLEPHHEVLAVTLAGHFGGPETDHRGATLETLVDAVENDMDEAGLGTAHVAGGSLGGWVALELGRRGS